MNPNSFPTESTASNRVQILTPRFAAAEPDRNDQILTRSQAADLLGMRPQTVFEWIKADKLKAFRVGRAVRLKRGQVLAALQAQTTDGRRKYAGKASKQKGR